MARPLLAEISSKMKRALRVCPAVTRLTVYRRLSVLRFKLKDNLKIFDPNFVMYRMVCKFVLQFDNFRGRFEQYDERMQSESSRRRRNNQNIGSWKCQFRMSKILFIVLRQIEIRRFMKNQPKLRLEPSIYMKSCRETRFWSSGDLKINKLQKFSRLRISKFTKILFMVLRH